ncbi:oligopeptide transport system substrate-binding protein [Alteromonadaceae bacterium 2753L.S.0a.02]|nr:oligopeptide transport system substrate-binding protein [Alteromonadaceae bacterium 2753L.S.0a.02]
MLTTRRSICSFTLAFLLALTGCTDKPANTQPDPEQTLRIAIGAAPQSLDPHLVAGVPAMKILAALFEPLLVMNPITTEPEPGVAESWEISADGKHYTFQLRDSAKWSDGSPVTAKDFVFGWKRILSPGISSNYALDYYVIEGAPRYHQGKTRDFGTVGVKATGEHQLEFFLQYPDPLFLKRLTHESTLPVQEAAITKFAAYDDPVSEWTRPPNLISNGPFYLTEWRLNQKIVALKNPYYWRADEVKLEKIIFIPAEDTAATERMFRSGQIDMDYGGQIPSEKIATYQKEAPDKLVIKPGYASYYYDFNTQRTPFNNVNVRRAFVYAIDRQKIVERISKAGQIASVNLAPRGENFSPNSPISFDPEKARQFLAAAGYPNGEGFPPVTLKYNTYEGHRKVSIALQQMWKEYLGIEVALENQEWKVFLNTRRNHDFDICRDGASSTFADPMDLLAPFSTGHEMNSPDWQNPAFDELVTSAKKELNTEKRMAILEQAEEILLDQVPVIPIYYYSYSYLISPAVKGMHFGRVEKPDYKTIYIDRSAQGQ